MKNVFFILIVISAIVALFIWVEPFSLLFTSNNTDTEDYANSFNLYREREGLEPLMFTDDLNCIAQKRLEEIKSDYSHESKGQYNRHLSENIVNRIYNNDQALEAWQESFLHRANMLSTSYKNTGYAAGGRFAVQLFSEYETINGEPILSPGWHFND